jgi:sec-independent protein translocase protein TatA
MFDPSAPHIIILLVVVLLLFGSTRLPGAAEALGKSMRIFKSEAKKLQDDKAPDGATVTPVASWQQPAPPQPLPGQPVVSQPVVSQPAQDATQQQMADLQRQIQDLQRQSAGGEAKAAADTPLPEAQGAQQPSAS